MITWLEKHNKISWTFTLLTAVAIFYVSTLIFAPSLVYTLNIRAILYHILAFFFLTFFLIASISPGRKINLFIPTLLLALIYAGSDEIHQFFVPGRSFSLTDIWLDSIGIRLASVIYLASKK